MHWMNVIIHYQTNKPANKKYINHQVKTNKKYQLYLNKIKLSWKIY